MFSVVFRRPWVTCGYVLTSNWVGLKPLQGETLSVFTASVWQKISFAQTHGQCARHTFEIGNFSYSPGNVPMSMKQPLMTLQYLNLR